MTLRSGVFVTVCFLARLAGSQLPPVTSPAAPYPLTPLFSTSERDAVMGYWAPADRYTVALPDDALDKGVWQVRLTPEGSQWLWNVGKGKKANSLSPFDPASTASPDTDAWVAARLLHDRWEAYHVALQANQKTLGKALPVLDSTIPDPEPPDPGPMPRSLLATAGVPPKLARAVVPMQHQIRFDDITLTYVDHFRPGSPRYPFFRFAQGVDSEGTQVKTLPPERLDHFFRMAGISDSEARVMRAVSLLEGGFDSINTYDTGFVSVGFIQFACLKDGAGALGQMMLLYKSLTPDQYQKDFRAFGIDVTATGSLAVIDPTTGGEVYGADAAGRIIEDKRLIAVFQRAGQRSDPYIAAQIASAKASFYPANDSVSLTLNGQIVTAKVSDILQTEAGMATLMDRKVNTGNLGNFAAIVTQVAQDHQVSVVPDLSKYEYEIVKKIRYRKDYLTDPTLTQPQPVSARVRRSRRRR